MGNYRERKPEREPTVGKTETFWTRNVKLITFIICITLFLGIFGPISVFRIRDHINEQRKKEDMSKPAITFENVIGLSKMGKGKVTWDTLDQFRSSDNSTRENKKLVLRISDDVEVWATGDIDSAKPEEMLLICFIDGSKCDIYGGGVETYIKEIKQILPQ